MVSAALFQVNEYEQIGIRGQLFTSPADLSLRLYYQSGLMGLRDASRFAAALSYSRGTYVSVTPGEPDKEKHREWWLAGRMHNSGSVPPILPERAVSA